MIKLVAGAETNQPTPKSDGRFNNLNYTAKYRQENINKERVLFSNALSGLSYSLTFAKEVGFEPTTF